METIARRRFHWKRLGHTVAVPAWLLIGWGLIETLHTLGYIGDHLNWLATAKGNLFVILFGFVWLFAVALWPSHTPENEDGEEPALRRVASVKLLTPLNHAQVAARRTVAGSVWPPNSKVQVFVMPGDGWWYTQGERRQATVDDSSWNLECTFGTPETGFGSNYQIIAIANANIRESRISALPSDGIRSEIIKVRRSS
jgi:hypothetical protein